ncbi:M1 family aminopeptidase [Brevundimonas sp. R86498]|uniref:M1 family aminopeptidase n=1 Tax=Brevundimonas sp. R86498 TaxID=3093845 RepID=UPI0037C5D8FB
MQACPRRQDRSAAAAFAAVFLAGLLGACASSGVSRLPPGAVAGIDVLHQTVEITPFPVEGGLTGTQTIDFRPTAAGDRLRFRGGPLEIRSLALDAHPVSGWTAQDGTVDIPLARPLVPGRRHTLSLTYEAAPGRGFRRSADLAWSTYFTCDWMLCDQEDFADRFTVDLTVQTPPGMLTLGPGVHVATTRPGPDTALHHWRTTEAYPAYVHAFVAGRLERHKPASGCTTQLEVLTTAPADRVAAIFGPTCAMLSYFEGRAGVPYPAEAYSQLYVPDRWEAQEAISHSTLGGGAVEALIADPSEDWAVAHELAHQWWGNRITAATLGEFWLNEGVVTFMVASWKEHRWGRAAYDREIELARARWHRCRTDWRDVPLAFDGPYPSLTARRCVQYSKAAVFLHELRQQMGDAAFWAGLGRFTVVNLGRAVTSRDLEHAMQRASDADLRPLFADWVDTRP